MWKKFSKRTILFVIFTVAIIFVASFLYFNFKNLKQSELASVVAVTNSDQQEENSIIGLPVRLMIPSINLDVAIEYVGFAEDGAMDIPKNTDKVGLFEPGTKPGEEGSAIIAGHYGLYAGKPSAFNDLHKLRSGDKIYVEDEKGLKISFVVRESRIFDPTADTVEIFSADDENSHLNLITCEGAWDKNLKSYPKRLVVFSDKE